jgi:serine/threonine protein kinase
MAENLLLNNRYRLIEQQGSGGMAVVYRAQDMELARIVAVKVLRPNLTADPEFLIRFRQEARAAANLSHPNIVTVHDVGQDGRTHYIVMEYIEGQDLKQLIRASAPFDVDSALAICVEICKGVGYAHRAGLAHCDIKPQNVLVTEDLRIKVTDFGIARALSAIQPGDTEEMVWGSPHYFSPEQATGNPPTPASDVYSIGVVLFVLLTGRLPFTGGDYEELALAHVRQPPPHVREFAPAVPLELDHIINKVLSKEPAARYRTADQLGRILQKYRERGQQPTVASFPVKPSLPAQPAEEPPARHGPPGVDTIPSPGLPPLDVGRQYQPPPAPARSAAPPPVAEPKHAYDEGAISIDFFGIVLGVLAAVAVLGLIPLWMTVYLTFAR